MMLAQPCEFNDASPRTQQTRTYCTISIYSVRPCDRDTFDGFGNSVLTIDYRDIKEISVDRVIDLVNLWVTPVNI